MDAGYADQAHMTRECAKLAGATPRALLASKLVLAASE
jgi:AraC-like DNA-binding protein